MKWLNHKFHFVGIGGIGMCGLAELLKVMGAEVSGSDIQENANVLRLRRLGINIFIGHQAQAVKGCDVVVYSGAVKEDNIEIQTARSLRIPLIARAEALAEIMRIKRGIAVGGTHGKTTTTSMCASIFLHARLRPTIVIGGRFDQIDSTAQLGDGDWMIAEADESDGSFHKLSPEIAIITNIDNDHLDFYKSFENLQNSFLQFAHKVPFYGSVIACGDDIHIKRILSAFPKQVVFYGFDSDNDYFLVGERGAYTIHTKTGKTIGTLNLQVPGQHNALNALASYLAAVTAGVDSETALQGLANYAGVDRRFQLKGEAKNVKVYDDYGHHPTEVRAALQAFKEKFPNNRVVTVFQPHRYSRTELCWSEFLSAFSQTDVLVLTDIYPAGERPIPGVTSERMASELKHAQVKYVAKDQVSQHLQNNLASGDILVTLGAGDGWKFGMQFLEDNS